MADETSVSLREKSRPIPSCELSKDDLLILYRRLREWVDDAADMEVKGWERPDDDQGEFESTIDWVKSLFVIVVTFEGQNGERQVGTDESIFSSPHLPDRIIAVTFDSASMHRLRRNNLNPQNWFRLVLDFSKPPRFDLANPVSNPTPNNSSILISGNDDGWVNSIYQTAIELVENRKNGFLRSWLHEGSVYDVLLWFGLMPVAFAIIHKFSPRIELLDLPQLVGWLFYAYVFLMIIMIFRLGFSYTKWVWPKIGLEQPRDDSKQHRVWWYSIFASVCAAVIFSLFFD